MNGGMNSSFSATCFLLVIMFAEGAYLYVHGIYEASHKCLTIRSILSVINWLPTPTSPDVSVASLRFPPTSWRRQHDKSNQKAKRVFSFRCSNPRVRIGHQCRCVQREKTAAKETVAQGTARNFHAASV